MSTTYEIFNFQFTQNGAIVTSPIQGIAFTAEAMSAPFNDPNHISAYMDPSGFLIVTAVGADEFTVDMPALNVGAYVLECWLSDSGFIYAQAQIAFDVVVAFQSPKPARGGLCHSIANGLPVPVKPAGKGKAKGKK